VVFQKRRSTSLGESRDAYFALQEVIGEVLSSNTQGITFMGGDL
jgi:hypothetical protein